ncbi:MAG: hypothetical protein HYV08_05210 [Deltaproteobacteria bacterium]|nr:hypothetical protein [Deltaproteobacteria bacterium]
MAGEAKTEEKAERPAKKMVIRIWQTMGLVSKVAPDSLTIKRKVKGQMKEMTFSLTDKTRVRMLKAKKAIGDVKEGSRVAVRYVEDAGKRTARAIIIMPPMKKGEEAVKEEAIKDVTKEEATKEGAAPEEAAKEEKK